MLKLVMVYISLWLGQDSYWNVMATILKYPAPKCCSSKRGFYWYHGQFQMLGKKLCILSWTFLQPFNREKYCGTRNTGHFWCLKRGGDIYPRADPLFSPIHPNQMAAARLAEWTSNHPSMYQLYIINITTLDTSFQKSITILLSENMAVLISLCSQPVKMVHIFSAPIQRNLSFTPYFMPYVGSWKNEGFSCQSLKAVQAPFQLYTASDLKVWHFTLASVSTMCSVSLVHYGKYSW